MADSEVLKKLKDIPLKIQTASVKGRCQVVEEIQDVLSSPGITEPIVRFVCRVLVTTLHRYRDSRSQFYIKRLIGYLATNHTEWTLKNLPQALLEISEQLKATATSKSVCQSGLIALRWSTLLVEGALKKPPENVEYTTLALCQANLLAVVAAYGDEKKNQKSYSLVHHAWSACGVERTAAWVQALLAAAEAGPQAPVAFSALCRHYSQIGEPQHILPFKAKMLESFIKTLITVKSRPNANYIKASADLLQLLDTADVLETLLPALQKAMLRSPETSIEAVGEVLNTLNIELDGPIVDIGKSLIGHLWSRDEWVRGAAQRSLAAAAARASPPCARALLQDCLQPLTAGKFSSPDDKIHLLQGVCALRGAGGADNTQVTVGALWRALAAESHERSLLTTLEALAQWRAPLDADTVTLIKKNVTPKTSQQVRIGYLIYMSRTLRHCPAPEQSAQIVDIAAGCLDRALPQILQPLSVSECICALACLSQLEGEALKSRQAAWLALAHKEKATLLQDRALAVSSDDVLIQVVWLCRSVIENHPNVASDKNSPIYRAIIMTLLSTVQSVRKEAISSVKEMIAQPNRALIARNLVGKLIDVLDEGKILASKEKTEEKGGEVTGKFITDCVHAVCSYREYPEEDLQLLALDALQPLHHPLVSDGRQAWRRLVRYLKLDPKELVQLYSSSLKKQYIDEFKPTETMSNVLSTLVSVEAGGLADCAMSYALAALQDPALAQVTRDEYFTYLTPPGDLYDKTVIPGNEDNKEMNLKRESKAYSYKEQLEEIQLKRELEEKRRKEGKIKEVPLTAKQKEAIKAQEAKENAIRERLTALELRVECGVRVVSCVAAGSVRALQRHARRAVPAALCAARCPLAAPRAASLYLTLRAALLPALAARGESLPRAALRLAAPACDLEARWAAEALDAAAARCVAHLLAAARSPAPLDAPAFCYTFPLLKEALTAPFAKSNESLLLNGIQVLTLQAEHAASAEPRHLYEPSLLPLEHVFSLLIELISTSTGRVQTSCTLALLATAQCGADFTPDEINCLLVGLQSPSAVVRDASLRALQVVQGRLERLLEDPAHAPELTKWLLVSCFDVVEENAELANKLWEQLPSAQPWCSSEALLMDVVCLIQHPCECVQRAAGDAIACLAANVHSERVPSLLRTFTKIYVDSLPLIPAKLDQFGHVVEEALDDWGARRGVAIALYAIAPLLAPIPEPEEEPEQPPATNGAVVDGEGEGVTVVGGEGVPVEEEGVTVVGGKEAPVVGGKKAPVVGGKKAPVEGGKKAPVEGGKEAPVVEGKKTPVVGAKKAPVVGGKEAPVVGGNGVAVVGGEGVTEVGPALVAEAVQFLVSEGLPDRAVVVREEMLKAALNIVDLHGKETISSQLPVFEKFLDRAPKSGGYDHVRQCVVLLVGTLARHLRPDDERVRPIALRLIQALSTPSQPVQEAVSHCLPHLVTSPALQDEIPAILNKLMKQLLTADKYGDRKGAAYGLAAMVKGLGILTLKHYDIMSKLTDAIQEKKSYKYREGAFFALEQLCLQLGRLFEPYIVHILPDLLTGFGDSSQYVRTASDEAARLIMSRLSAHGVKLVLPALLAGLQNDNWRTKAGSVEMLGSMAYCAPKQLSSCLPSIVPRLIAVLGDSHTRVQDAGAEALRVIGSVIRNPEIQAIVGVLLLALQEPSDKTSLCLQTLLDTKFVHFIDAPSLALIMPVVERAFQDRSTDTRKMAAQIIGNMYSLTDQKDLMPYLPSIIPGLKMSLLDPVPEVRSVSARALGAMVRGMGESAFEELLPWLMSTLTSEHSSVDRSGAAQGLAELVAGLGKDKLHKLMPDIIATAERTDIAPHVKDGYIMMFIYMPGAFTDEFLPYIGQIINPILKALADENEYVRETALKAGQRIVNLYADSAITLLLPELENGLFDDNWRIRYSSVQLLGDLLYRISGVSGKMSTETASEDDNFGTEQSHKAIIRALGVERRNRVLAGLYMGRSDVALMVRQAALHVWKVVVTNTPKTLREILPTLFGLLLGCLASTSYDKRQVAARTLGDLVRKLGERVLPEIIPILERGLKSDRADQRQGVCIGLGEIIASTSRDSILAFADGLVPTVRVALCDELGSVRVAAARTFDSLHACVGSKALDDILPHMLAELQHDDPKRAEAALDGLRQVMAIKSRCVLPYLVPQLTAPPVDTRALSALAAAAGDALAKHLHRVLPALLGALAAADLEAKELEHCRQALLPVTDDAGVRCIIDTLLDVSRGGGGADAGKKRAAAALLCAYVSHTRADLTHYVPQLIRGLLVLQASSDQEVVVMAHAALGCVTRALEAARLVAHVADVRSALRLVAQDLPPPPHCLLPGFCLPKGIAPILPLFRESILNGLPEEKEAAALMLAEVLRLTSPAAIQPSVVHVTGPLIRILGDRFNANVKAAVLETLALLLEKVGPSLKQFLPQLQTTFLKALGDASRPVRVKAGRAVAQLVQVHARADPFFTELHNGIKTVEDPAVRETMVAALRSIISLGGDKMSPTLALSLLGTLAAPALLAGEDAAAAGCLGALLHCLPAPHRAAALQHHVLAPPAAADAALLQGRSCALFVALKETPQAIYADGFEDKIDKALLGYLASDRVPVVCNGVRGIAYLMKYLLDNERTIPQNMISQFVRSMNHPSNEVKQVVCVAGTWLGSSAALTPSSTTGAELLRALLPALVNGTKEKNTCVRADAELALRAVLRLGTEEDFHAKCGSLLDAGAREALADVVSRVARRAPAPAPPADALDCTLIT